MSLRCAHKLKVFVAPAPCHAATPRSQNAQKSLSSKQFLTALVSNGGLKGTLALLIAKLIGVDPFGNFHWSADDVALALVMQLPILLADAAVMLPDFKELKQAAGAGAAGAGAGAPPAKPAEAPLWDRMAEVAGRLQRKRVVFNPGLGMSLAQEGTTILVTQLAEEIAARAVLMGGLTGWARDRLLEADLAYESAAALAPFLALSAILGFEAGRLKRSLLRTTPASGKLLVTDKATGKQEVIEISRDSIDEIAASGKWRGSVSQRVAALSPPRPGEVRDPAAAEKSRKESAERVAGHLREAYAALERQAELAQVESIRYLGNWACVGSAFAVTNNLAATFAAAVVSDTLFSAYQRRGMARLKAQEKELLLRAIANFKRDPPPGAAEEVATGEERGSAASSSSDRSSPPAGAGGAAGDDSLQPTKKKEDL